MQAKLAYDVEKFSNKKTGEQAPVFSLCQSVIEQET